MTRPPKTAILGAAGFLGRHLLRAYRAHHPDCAATDVEGRLGLPKLDLADPDIAPLRLRETGHEWAVIAAAVPRPDRFERDREFSRKRNVDGTLELARRLAADGVGTIFVSSDYVFDGRTGGYSEESPTAPLNEYGRQKAEVERLLPQASGGRCLILRPGKLFSLEKGDNTLLDEMAARLSAGQPVRAAADQRFCPTLVDDAVAAAMALQSAGASGLFNICAPEAWTRLDLARALAKALGADPSLVRSISLDDLGEELRRPKDTTMATDKLRRAAPVRYTPMAECLAKVAEGYRRAAAVPSPPGWRPLNEDVFFPEGPLASVSQRELDFLKEQASRNARGRARLCGHSNDQDKVHEMMVAVAQRSYIHPHKHRDKVESYHVIEGRADLVTFDDQGRLLDVVELGDRSTGRRFYVRDSGAAFHTMLIHSSHLVYHETTRGPFQRADTVYASWAPEERRPEAVKAFQDGLRRSVRAFLEAKGAA